jgi:ferritin
MDVKVEKALNEQIHAEFFSFYLYLSVSAYFSAQRLDGFAHWMKIQAQEELAHAMKLFDYLNERGGSVQLGAMEAPQREWASPSAAVEAVLNTAPFCRESRAGQPRQLRQDHATTVVLHWYVNEQVRRPLTLFHQVRMMEGSPHGLLMLDRELAGRTLSAAPPAE